MNENAGSDRDMFVGHKAQEMRGILKLSYPTAHGITTDWKDLQVLAVGRRGRERWLTASGPGAQYIWEQTYKELNIKSDDHPVLLTQPPLNSRSNMCVCAAGWGRDRAVRPASGTLLLTAAGALSAKAAEIFFETFRVPAFHMQIQAILAL
jgi:centractin